jgi:hypothetical protein
MSVADEVVLGVELAHTELYRLSYSNGSESLSDFLNKLFRKLHGMFDEKQIRP